MGITADEYATAIAEQLRAERSARRLTFKELAERSGINEQSVLRYLNGKRDIPIPALYALAEGLEVTVHEVIARAESRLPGQD